MAHLHLETGSDYASGYRRRSWPLKISMRDASHAVPSRSFNEQKPAIGRSGRSPASPEDPPPHQWRVGFSWSLADTRTDTTADSLLLVRAQVARSATDVMNGPTMRATVPVGSSSWLLIGSHARGIGVGAARNCTPHRSVAVTVPTDNVSSSPHCDHQSATSRPPPSYPDSS
jgi:hypothetical protein